MTKKYNGKLIFSTRNEQGAIEVVETATLRNLHFGTPVIQSSMFLNDFFALEMEYNRVMMLALLYHSRPVRALFLGLGGASKPKFLWRYFPSCTCDIIEINPSVIEVAELFFETPKDKRFNIIQEDAAQFIQKNSPAGYDLIFIDIYVAGGIAAAISAPSFFQACKKLLCPQGMLIWNMWSTTALPYLNACKEAFTHHRIAPVEESPNLIVFAWDSLPPATSPVTLQQLTGMDFPSLARRF